ncbi:beta strand repeat-containing protein, partial [Algimonas arctica]|uniref:beta strand repeat-containing protein n=1 Tax=Algimonas arctica TaxID=1479486 RepID=UPI0016759041
MPAFVVNGGAFVPDTTSPIISSFTRKTPSGQTTNSDSLTFLATFDEDVTGISSADFMATGTTAMVSAVSQVTAATYDVTVSGGDLANFVGTVGLAPSAGMAYQDLAGNAGITAAPATSETYSLVQVPDAPSSLALVSVVALADNNADVSFSWNAPDTSGNGSAVFQQTGTAYTDATCTTPSALATGGGGIASTETQTLTFGPPAYLPGATGSLNIVAVNAIGNSLPSNCVSFTMPADTTAPTLTAVSIASNNTNTAKAKDGDAIIVSFTSDEALDTPPVVTIYGGGTTVTGSGTSWSAVSTVDGTSPEGDAAINISGFKDAAGNTATAVTATTDGSAVDVDRTAPTVSSIDLFSGQVSPTDDDAISWGVQFSEDVTLDSNGADFVFSGLSTASKSASNVSDSFYEVSTANGDLVNFNGTVTVSLAPGQTITDKAGNALVNTAVTGTNDNSIEVVNDATAPVLIVGLASNNANTTLAKAGDVITATIVADEPLAAAPTVTIAGETATVTGSGTTWSGAITVSGSTTEGAVAINISAYEDAGGNAGTTVSATTDASAVTIGRVPDAPSNLQVSYVFSPAKNLSPDPNAAVFTEVLLNWTNNPLNGPTDTVLAPHNIWFEKAGACTSSRTNGSGLFLGTTSFSQLLHRTTFPEGTTVSLQIIANNDFGESASSNCVTIVIPPLDLTAPSVTSVVRTTPATENTDADTLTWTVTFDEEVSLIDSTDFEFTGTTANASVTMQSATVYQVTASGGDLASYNGQVGLAFAAGQNIADQIGFNALTNTVPTGLNQTYQLTNDNTLPTLTSIVRKTPLGEKTNADSLTWAVTFSEDVQNLDATDFSVSGTTATVGVTGSGVTYDVTASGGDLAGLGSGFGAQTVSLALAAGQNIQDLSGNALSNLSATGATESYAVNNGALTIASITRVDSGTQAPAAQLTNADSLAWDVQFSGITGEFSLSPADFTLTGTTATIASVDRYSIGFIVQASGGDLADLNGNVTLGFANTTPVDEFGNAFTDKTPRGVSEDSYTLDNAAPTLVSIVPDAGTASLTDADTISFIFTYSENLDVSAANIANVLVTGTTATVTITPISASVARVTLTGGDLADLNGPVTVGLNEVNNVTDPAGNPIASINPTGVNNNSVQIQNDGVAPTLVITSTSSDPVSGAFPITVTFNEDVSGFVLGDLTVGNGA